MRWANNPTVGDRAGQGAVPRQGMMALDVETGLPFSWNPGRERGVGLFDYHVTAAGVVGGQRHRSVEQRVAPAAGVLPVDGPGSSLVPANVIGSLPGNVLLLGRFRRHRRAPIRRSCIESMPADPRWRRPTTAPNGPPTRRRRQRSATPAATPTINALTVGTYDIDRADQRLRSSAGGAVEHRAVGSQHRCRDAVELPGRRGHAHPGATVHGQQGHRHRRDRRARLRHRPRRRQRRSTIIDLSNSPGHNIGTMRVVQHHQ